jgi:hypothetical protein
MAVAFSRLTLAAFLIVFPFSASVMLVYLAPGAAA